MSTEGSDTSTQCMATKPDGLRCKATALPGLDCCLFHDPSRATERRAAQSLGGQHNRMKTLDAGTPNVNITNAADVVALLAETINQVRKGDIDPRVANTIAYLADVSVRTIRVSEDEARIRKLEQVVSRRLDLLSGG